MGLREPLPKFECMLNEWQLLAQALPGASGEGVLDGVLTIQPVACRQAALAASSPSRHPKDAGLILCITMPKTCVLVGKEVQDGFFRRKAVHL